MRGDPAGDDWVVKRLGDAAGEASGHRRDFHGWLELNIALEAMLDTGEAASVR